jgi:hypothetical protein
MRGFNTHYSTQAHKRFTVEDPDREPLVEDEHIPLAEAGGVMIGIERV